MFWAFLVFLELFRPWERRRGRVDVAFSIIRSYKRIDKRVDGVTNGARLVFGMGMQYNIT